MNYSNLNEMQLQAVKSDLGPVLVIAGAGTGKTKVLISKIAYLVEERNFAPWRILGITFTNKAANEMKERLGKQFESTKFTWINTFHSFCLKFLREEIHLLGYKNSFTIVDDDDKRSCMYQIYLKHNLSKETLKISDALKYIDRCKSENISIHEYVQRYKTQGKLSLGQCQQLITIYDAYIAYLKEKNYLDFDDLLNLTHQIIIKYPDVLEKWANRFDYILIDEFQDTDNVQYEVISKIASKNRNIFAVGDPDQSIYSWRGANTKIMDIFMNDFPDYKVYILERNYRSTQQILNAANDVIANNNGKFYKQLFSDQTGSLVQYHVANSQDSESIWIVNRIKNLIREGKKYGDITILYRANFLTRNIEQTLISAKIPYYIYGGVRFWQRKEIKDLIAYLRVINDNDEISLWRILNSPNRKVSEKSIEKLANYASNNNMPAFETLRYANEIDIFKPAIKNVMHFYHVMSEIKEKTLSISDTLKLILQKTDYMQQYDQVYEKDRHENVKELLDSIKKYEEQNLTATLTDYLQDIQLYTATDEETKKDCVTLMTVHMAKGLEFNYVFILGLVENIFPSTRAESQFELEEKIKEERRIMYVAITRARQGLFLTSCGGLNYDNTTKMPSRFIFEINNDHLDHVTSSLHSFNGNKLDIDWFDSQKAVNYDKYYYKDNEAPEYMVGDVIQHTTFGEGIVMEVKQRTIVVVFKNIRFGEKEILSNHKSIIRKNQ